MSEIKAVIFDLDGVITSTDEYHYLAWKKLFDELGIKFDCRDNEKIKGVGRRESFEVIAGCGFEDMLVEMYLKQKNGYYLEFLNGNQLHPLPGIMKFLDELTLAGIKKAIASGSRNAPKILNNLGMPEMFDVIVDGSMCTKSKPAPDLFLLAAEKLLSHPVACVVIEDSQAGIDAAAGAGMKSIGIGASLKNADIILKNTQLLNIATVLDL